MNGELAVIGGIVLTKEYFLRLDAKWREVLATHNIQHPIHMREFARPDGNLAYLSDDQRRVLFADLVQVINNNKLYGLSASMSEAQFREFFPANRFRNLIRPASMSFVYCLVLNHAIASTNSNIGKIAYLVAHSDESNQMTEMHRLMLALEEYRKTDRTGSIAFDTPQNVSALQASDMVAWSCRRKLLGQAFDRGFQPLERLTRVVRAYEHDYFHFHRDATKKAAEQLAAIVNQQFPKLPKIGFIKMLLNTQDIKQVKSALRQASAETTKKKKNLPR